MIINQKGFKICSYIGKHEIDEETLNNTLKKIGYQALFGTVSD